jgi:hypothetical protein
MFHRESLRVVLGSVVALAIFMTILSFFEKKSYQYEYKIGECSWHLHQSKNPDGTYKRNIFKIIDVIEIKGEPYYITDVLNWHYRFNHFSPKLSSATYTDSYHPKYTHEQKCRNGIRKDLVQKCIEDKDWEWNAGGMECPTREQYCKELKEKTGEECWENK